jgi:hypothetical protein
MTYWWDAIGSTLIEWPYTSASNRARRISERRSEAKTEWEANKYGKHFSDWLNTMVGAKRPTPMTSIQRLDARFYPLKSGHPPTEIYLKWCCHHDDDKCWWCGGTVFQMREHLFCHCSLLRVHLGELWKAVRKATGWRVGRYRHVLNSEHFSITQCDPLVMDLLAASEVGRFLPNWSSGMEQAQGLGLSSGIGGRRVIPFLLSCFDSIRLTFCLSLICRLSTQTKGSAGGAPPSCRLARRRRGYQGPVILQLESIQYD